MVLEVAKRSEVRQVHRSARRVVLSPTAILIFALRAGVVKLADARDSKSRGVHSPCGFDSHLRHH
jgi:hypothetical protein